MQCLTLLALLVGIFFIPCTGARVILSPAFGDVGDGPHAVGPHNNPWAFALNTIAKRTDPVFSTRMWEDHHDGDQEQILKDAVDDVRNMIRFIHKHWDETAYIRKWYWVEEDWNDVRKVFQNILPEQRDAAGHWIAKPNFSPVMSRYFYVTEDWNGDCEEEHGNAAMTYNWDASMDLTDEMKADPQISVAQKPFATTIVCDSSFEMSDRYAHRLADRQCSDFISPTTGTYHLHKKMNSIAQTLMHEMSHFAEVASNLGKPPRNPPYIEEAGHPSGEVLPVEDFHTGMLPVLNCPINDKTVCKHNADSYGWYAAQVYWTIKCKDVLGDPKEHGIDKKSRCPFKFLRPNKDTADGGDHQVDVSGTSDSSEYDPDAMDID